MLFRSFFFERKVTISFFSSTRRISSSLFFFNAEPKVSGAQPEALSQPKFDKKFCKDYVYAEDPNNPRPPVKEQVLRKSKKIKVTIMPEYVPSDVPNRPPKDYLQKSDYEAYELVVGLRNSTQQNLEEARDLIKELQSYGPIESSDDLEYLGLLKKREANYIDAVEELDAQVETQEKVLGIEADRRKYVTESDIQSRLVDRAIAARPLIVRGPFSIYQIYSDGHWETEDNDYRKWDYYDPYILPLSEYKKHKRQFRDDFRFNQEYVDRYGISYYGLQFPWRQIHTNFFFYSLPSFDLIFKHRNFSSFFGGFARWMRDLYIRMWNILYLYSYRYCDRAISNNWPYGFGGFFFTVPHPTDPNWNFYFELPWYKKWPRWFFVTLEIVPIYFLVLLFFFLFVLPVCPFVYFVDSFPVFFRWFFLNFLFFGYFGWAKANDDDRYGRTLRRIAETREANAAKNVLFLTPPPKGGPSFFDRFHNWLWERWSREQQYPTAERTNAYFFDSYHESMFYVYYERTMELYDDPEMWLWHVYLPTRRHKYFSIPVDFISKWVVKFWKRWTRIVEEADWANYMYSVTKFYTYRSWKAPAFWYKYHKYESHDLDDYRYYDDPAVMEMYFAEEKLLKNVERVWLGTLYLYFMVRLSCFVALGPFILLYYKVEGVIRPIRSFFHFVAFTIYTTIYVSPLYLYYVWLFVVRRWVLRRLVFPVQYWITAPVRYFFRDTKKFTAATIKKIKEKIKEKPRLETFINHLTKRFGQIFLFFRILLFGPVEYLSFLFFTMFHYVIIIPITFIYGSTTFFKSCFQVVRMQDNYYRRSDYKATDLSFHPLDPLFRGHRVNSIYSRSSTFELQGHRDIEDSDGTMSSNVTLDGYENPHFGINIFGFEEPFYFFTSQEYVRNYSLPRFTDSHVNRVMQRRRFRKEFFSHFFSPYRFVPRNSFDSYFVALLVLFRNILVLYIFRPLLVLSFRFLYHFTIPAITVYFFTWLDYSVILDYYANPWFPGFPGKLHPATVHTFSCALVVFLLQRGVPFFTKIFPNDTPFWGALLLFWYLQVHPFSTPGFGPRGKVAGTVVQWWGLWPFGSGPGIPPSVGTGVFPGI